MAGEAVTAWAVGAGEARAAAAPAGQEPEEAKAGVWLTGAGGNLEVAVQAPGAARPTTTDQAHVS